ncbi:MAG: hypothetical protein U0522_02975 [Candidatus Paceibacterota bacterium]
MLWRGDVPLANFTHGGVKMVLRPQTEVERLATYSVAKFRANPRMGLPIAIIEVLRYAGREYLYENVLNECRRRSQIKRRAKSDALKNTTTQESKPCQKVTKSHTGTDTPFLPGMEPTKKYRLT